jgi:hypothetical protein
MIFNQPGDKAVDRASHNAAAGEHDKPASDPASQSAA